MKQKEAGVWSYLKNIIRVMVLVHQGSIFNVSTLVALIYCLTSSLVFKPYGVLNKTSHTSKLL